MRFEFVLGVGMIPLRFDMSVDEVHAALGQPPRVVLENPSGETGREEHFNDFVGVHYNKNDRLYSVVFAGSVDLILDDVPLLGNGTIDAALQKLLEMDSEPLEEYGFVVFDKLGIAITGILIDVDDDLAVTIVRPGTWPLDTKKPLLMSRLRGAVGRMVTGVDEL